MRYVFWATFRVVLCAGLLFSGTPNGPGDFLRQGKALEKADRIGDAVTLYSSALKALSPIDRSPGVEELYRSLSVLLGKLNRYDEGLRVLSEGLGKFPGSTALLNLQGLLKFRQGAVGDAGKIWERVLAIAPENQFARQWLGKVKARKPVPIIAGNSDLLIGLPAGNKGGKPPSKASGSPAPGGPAASALSSTGSLRPLSVEDQRKLGQQLYLQMSRMNKWDLDQFADLHQQVISKCPETDWAEESCWRLSNLYLTGLDEPDFPGIIKTLEHLIEKYPDSPLIPDAKTRLLIAYRETGRNDKVVEFYQEIFRLNPSPTEKQSMLWSLEYADALSATGNKVEARKLYEKIVEQDNRRDQLEARVARARLAGM
jgi:tetratricopeptide (TPR) repeat protein